MKQSTLDEFKKGCLDILGLYLDCKGALKLWQREVHLVLSDKIIDEVIQSEIFGDKAVVQKSILSKIDKLMTAHLAKE